MERPHPTLARRTAARPDWMRALIVLVAILAVMAVLTVVLGVTRDGPGYELLTDPGAALGF